MLTIKTPRCQATNLLFYSNWSGAVDGVTPFCNALNFRQPKFAVEIKKAVITAAGKSQRTLPLQTLVDRDGVTKTALRIIIEEIHSAGIEDICVVICPGDEDAFATAAGSLAGGLKFVPQTESLGYGHAVFCARQFIGNNPFLLLVGDH